MSGSNRSADLEMESAQTTTGPEHISGGWNKHNAETAAIHTHVLFRVAMCVCVACKWSF